MHDGASRKSMEHGSIPRPEPPSRLEHGERAIRIVAQGIPESVAAADPYGVRSLFECLLVPCDATVEVALNHELPGATGSVGSSSTALLGKHKGLGEDWPQGPTLNELHAEQGASFPSEL
jgi:hypothetical protein